MPRYPAASTLAGLIHRLTDTGAWMFLVEVPRVAGGFYRLVKGSRNIEAGGVKWIAAAMEIRPPEEDADGGLGELSIALPNPSRLIMAAVEVENELLGQRARLILAHTEILPSLSGAVEWRHTILRAEITEPRAELVCGHEAAAFGVPGGVIGRDTFPQIGT